MLLSFDSRYGHTGNFVVSSSAGNRMAVRRAISSVLETGSTRDHRRRKQEQVKQLSGPDSEHAGSGSVDTGRGATGQWATATGEPARHPRAEYRRFSHTVVARPQTRCAHPAGVLDRDRRMGGWAFDASICSNATIREIENRGRETATLNVCHRYGSANCRELAAKTPSLID